MPAVNNGWSYGVQGSPVIHHAAFDSSGELPSLSDRQTLAARTPGLGCIMRQLRYGSLAHGGTVPKYLRGTCDTVVDCCARVPDNPGYLQVSFFVNV